MKYILFFIILISQNAYSHLKVSPIELKKMSFEVINIKVPHACELSKQTNKLVIDFPHNVFIAKPKYKYGWEAKTITSKISEPKLSRNKVYLEEVSRLILEGELSTDYYDDFNINVLTPDSDELVIKIHQFCEDDDDEDEYFFKLK